MFTATITNKDFRGGVFQVTVQYLNGTDTFTEAYNILSEEDLDNRIGNKIDTLNRLLELETTLTIGEWTKKETPAPVGPTALEVARTKIYELKEKINLGVMKETDQEFIDAVAAYKLAEITK